MATTTLSIVNTALVRVGEARLKSLDQAGKAARVAEEQYPKARRRLLMTFNWTFAVKRASLPALSEAPEFGFGTQYALPADCIRLIGVSTGTEDLRNYTGTRLEYKVEGRNVLADVPGNSAGLQIFYVADIDDPTQFDPLFEDALAWYLASSDFAYDLSAAQNRVVVAEGKYQAVLKEARLYNAIQSTPELFEASEWVDSRNLRAGAGPRRGPVA